jgi:putative endonuclease
MYFLYLLECMDGTIYTGITTDVKRRFAEHKEGIGSRYTRSRKAKRLLYAEKHRDRSSASKREAEVKRMTRTKKRALVKTGNVS